MFLFYEMDLHPLFNQKLKETESQGNYCFVLILCCWILFFSIGRKHLPKSECLSTAHLILRLSWINLIIDHAYALIYEFLITWSLHFHELKTIAFKLHPTKVLCHVLSYNAHCSHIHKGVTVGNFKLVLRVLYFVAMFCYTLYAKYFIIINIFNLTLSLLLLVLGRRAGLLDLDTKVSMT